MTPEAATDIGKRAARDLHVEISGAIWAGEPSPEGVLSAMEADIEAELGASRSTTIEVEHIAIALRGAASFWREFAAEIEARAAALEATR